MSAPATTIVDTGVNALGGMSNLTNVSLAILTFALVISLAAELIKVASGRASNFFGPLLRIGLGIVIVLNLKGIGRWFESAGVALGGAVAGKAELALFKQAFAHVAGHSVSFSLWDFGVDGLFMLFSLMLCATAVAVHALMMQFLWPVAMSVVVVVGTIAVPLSGFPGFEGALSGWFKNLLEVSLWPLVFKMLLGLLVASHGSFLSSVKALDLKSDAIVAVSGVAEGVGAHPKVRTGLKRMTDPSIRKKGASTWGTMMRFGGMCLGYILLCLMTPVIASLVVRQSPAGQAMTSLASKVVAAGATGAGVAAGAAGAAAGLAGGALATRAAGAGVVVTPPQGWYLGAGQSAATAVGGASAQNATASAGDGRKSPIPQNVERGDTHTDGREPTAVKRSVRE